MHHCTWFGVICDDDNTTVLHLLLPRNGLAGEISPSLFNVTSLQTIDLNDNELYGTIPSELGMLTDLKKLRLSYNELTGIPTTFGLLTNLSFLHLHGNRISGDDSYITVVSDSASSEEHAFVADCGDPVDSSEPFECDSCDMCCNSLEECQVPITSSLDRFDGYVLSLIIASFVIALLIVYGAIVKILVRRKVFSPSKTNARSACGEGSVYSFVLTKSYIAWTIAFLAVLIQVSIFALFINASQFNNEVSDWVYSWRCPKNSETCDDERIIGAYGWVVWGLLVITAVLEDLVNGIKLISLAASRSDMHCFCGSAIILAITALALWTSATYNRAIAMSSTELIVNAVILLFVNDIDEQLYNAVQVINPKWVGRIDSQADALSSRLLAQATEDDKLENEEEGNLSDGRDTFYPADTWESSKRLGSSTEQKAGD